MDHPETVDAKKVAAVFAKEFVGEYGNADVRAAILTERLTPVIQGVIRAVAAQCADLADSRCGLDAEPYGMTCAPVAEGGRVYHEPRCCRVEADCIREAFGVG